MIISVASDHAGFALKEAIKKHLIEKDFDVLDEGTYSPEVVDYPLFAVKTARDVSLGKATFGIVCCGSGEGVSIVANKVQGIRCGIGYNDDVSALLRMHNDANMIAFGARFMSEEDVIRRVDIFLAASFSGKWHTARIDEIKNIEKGKD